MKSGLKIRWTEEATNNLESIIAYLESNWTSKELTKFFQKLEKQILLLSHFPEAYPLSVKRRKIHRCVFTKNLTIYYTVEDECLVLLSLFDTRQNPSKVKI
jgi:plasmid stabilization system protein ParE